MRATISLNAFKIPLDLEYEYEVNYIFHFKSDFVQAFAFLVLKVWDII